MLDQFDVITFDCYGTLIDWETGIRRAFREAITGTRAEPDLEARAFKLYEMEERRIEKETPHLLYRDVLSKTALAVAGKVRWRLSPADVKSYKPAYGHFEEARRIIKDRPWVHVASSQYHDIEPALALGIRAVWVNRKNEVPLHKYSELGIMQIGDLRQLALHLGS